MGVVTLVVSVGDSPHLLGTGSIVDTRHDLTVSVHLPRDDTGRDSEGPAPSLL